MDKAKELTKNPFKIKNKQEKELNIINKILDNNKKVIDSEKDEKLTTEIEKLLLKTKDAIQAHIRGNVLSTLGYVDFADLFFAKASELGYNVNENIELAQADEDVKVEEEVKSKLLNNTITKITKSDTDTQLTITDVIFEFGNIILKLNDETTEKLTYNDADKLLRGFQVVKLSPAGTYYALMMENTVDEKKNMNENMNITEEQLNDIKSKIVGKFMKFEWSGFFDTSTSVITDIIINNGMAEILTNTGFEKVKIEELNDLAYGKQVGIRDSQGEYIGLQIVNDNGIVENSVDNTCDCEEGNCNCKNVNEDYELNVEIANDLLPKIQAIKNETGKFTEKDLENQILNNGGTLEMLDGVMAELVNMGFDFDKDVEEADHDLFNLINNKYQLSELLQRSLKTVLNDYESAISVDERKEAINAIAALVDDSFDNVSQMLSDNLISNENLANVEESLTNFQPLSDQVTQKLPLAEELKNTSIFGIELPEKGKKEYSPEAIMNVINSDPFLKFSYHELNTGDFEKDMEMIYKTYIKDNDELVSKLLTMESYVGMLKENSLSKSPNINVIEMILNKNNINPLNYKDILFNIENIINENLQFFRHEFVLLTSDFKTNFRTKMSEVSALELSDMILTSELKFNDDTETIISKLNTKFGFNDESYGLFIYNVLSYVKDTLTKTDIENIQLYEILMTAVSAIILKAL